MSITSPPHHKDDEGNDVKADVAVISDRTPVRMGIILGVLLPTAVWSGFWASNVSSSLKVLVEGITELRENMKGYESRISSAEKAINDIRLTGSPRVQELDKRLTILEQDFKLHVLTTTPRSEK